MRLSRRFVNLELVTSVAMPPLSRVARAADTIKIGMVLRSLVRRRPSAGTRSPGPRSRSIASTNPAACWANRSN